MNMVAYIQPTCMYDMELFYTGATVALQTPTDISTPEGNDGQTMTVDLCVRLTNIMGGLRRNVVLNLNTVEVTAGEGKFHHDAALLERHALSYLLFPLPQT